MAGLIVRRACKTDSVVALWMCLLLVGVPLGLAVAPAVAGSQAGEEDPGAYLGSVLDDLGDLGPMVPAWTFTRFESTAASDGERVFVVGHDVEDERPSPSYGHTLGDRTLSLFALDLEDGGEVWSVFLGTGYDRGPSTPAVHDGRVFVYDQSGRVWGVDAMDGTVLWYTELGGGFVGFKSLTPVVHNGLVFVVANVDDDPDGVPSLVALDETHGEVVWSAKLPDRTAELADRAELIMQAAGDYVMVSSYLYVVSHRVEDGQFAWSVDNTDFFDPSHEGWQYVGLSGLDATRNSVKVAFRSDLDDLDSGERTVTDGVIGLDPGSGEVQWQTTLRSPAIYDSLAPPVGDERQVFAGSANKAFALDADTGTIQWSMTVVGAVVGILPTLTRDEVIFPVSVQSMDDPNYWSYPPGTYLLALNRTTGNPEWTFGMGWSLVWWRGQGQEPTVHAAGDTFLVAMGGMRLHPWIADSHGLVAFRPDSLAPVWPDPATGPVAELLRDGQDAVRVCWPAAVDDHLAGYLLERSLEGPSGPWELVGRHRLGDLEPGDPCVTGSLGGLGEGAHLRVIPFDLARNLGDPTGPVSLPVLEEAPAPRDLVDLVPRRTIAVRGDSTPTENATKDATEKTREAWVDPGSGSDRRDRADEPPVPVEPPVAMDEPVPDTVPDPVPPPGRENDDRSLAPDPEPRVRPQPDPPPVPVVPDRGSAVVEAEVHNDGEAIRNPTVEILDAVGLRVEVLEYPSRIGENETVTFTFRVTVPGKGSDPGRDETRFSFRAVSPQGGSPVWTVNVLLASDEGTAIGPAALTGGVMATAALGSGIAFLRRGPGAGLGLAALFSRVTGAKVLDQKTRRRIHQAITEHPGIGYQQLKDRLGLSQGNLSHHLHRLRTEGFVTRQRDGRRVRLYPGTQAPQPTKAHGDTRSRLLDWYYANPGQSQTGAAEALGLTRQAVNHHVRQMQAKGVLLVERAGRKSAVRPRGVHG